VESEEQGRHDGGWAHAQMQIHKFVELAVSLTVITHENR
jgi:hypothetical protein